MCVTSIKPQPISNPGTIPAANKAPTETFIKKAYKIMIPLGGIMGPITDDAAVTAAAKRLE